MIARNKASWKWLVILSGAVVWTAGCFTKQPPKVSIANIVNLRQPIVPASAGTELEPPPDIAIEPLDTLPELATMRSAPAKPRVVAAPATEPEKTEKPAEPAIAPELSSQELQAAQAETQRNLDQVERNLTQATGRQLNASQQDLISKVHGFAETAREAMKSGDWVRAKNMSKKAAVLSEELVSNL